MKKTESTNSGKKAITVRLNPKDGLSYLDKNQNPDQEKTQEHRSSITGLTQQETKDKYNSEKAEIVKDKIGEEILGHPQKSNISEQMDEILKNNDKFETVKVLMVILCKELGIPEDSQFPTIAGALNKVWEAYYKSMEEWKLIAKSGQKTSIRQ